MTTQPLPEDQLLELLVQLQKTTPEQARAILNGQPAIGYALVPLMAKMGIVNLEVLQKTLSVYAAQSAGSDTTTAVPASVPPAVPSVPQHLTQGVQPPYGHHPTPPPVVPPQTQAIVNHSQTQGVHTPAPVAAQGASAYGGYPLGVQNGTGYGQYGQQQHQQQYGGLGQPQYGAQQTQLPPSGTTASTPAPGATAGAGMLGALGNIPDDQREMIMRVISMTPEQINRLPPQDRAITIQLRATLGLPTE